MSVDAPYVPSPQAVVERMLKVAKVTPNDVVYDLGAGDGRVPITAAKLYGVKAVGVEIRKELVEEAIKKVKELKLEDKVKIIHEDMFNVDVSEATVVTLYLLTSVNRRLAPKLEKELKPGARVVSHDFEVPDWVPDYMENFKESNGLSHKIFLYIMPPKKHADLLK